jgi:transposase InsO family protein
MKGIGLQAKMAKAWKRTTRRTEGAVVSPNYLNQQFVAQAPNKIWVSDISYIPTEEGWLYVCVSLDLFSRKVIGLSMGDSCKTLLVVKTFTQGWIHRKPEEGLMHHSDRGCQYTSHEFKILMDRYQVVTSMSGTGHCYDNAVMESFFHTLKTEHTDFFRFRTREEAKQSIFEYIEVFYNRERLHSTLGYHTPVEYELSWSQQRCSDS